MINEVAKKRSGLSKAAGAIGAAVGGIGGFILGGPPGAMAGAKAGGTAGGLVGNLTDKSGQGPASISPMQRRMDVIDQSPIQDVIDAKSQLVEAPPEIQQQAAPILDAALAQVTKPKRRF